VQETKLVTVKGKVSRDGYFFEGLNNPRISVGAEKPYYCKTLLIIPSSMIGHCSPFSIPHRGQQKFAKICLSLAHFEFSWTILPL
jgi:hypothetical protein